MFKGEKNKNIKKNSQQLNIKLALIYFLLILLFVSMMILL